MGHVLDCATMILVIYFLYNQMIVCANKRYREITNKSKLNQIMKLNYRTTQY